MDSELHKMLFKWTATCTITKTVRSPSTRSRMAVARFVETCSKMDDEFNGIRLTENDACETCEQ
eukprot:12407588-Karenia_brevis.AAC.1